MQRVAFSVFGIEIYFYSLFILLGMIVAYILIINESKKNNIDNEFITNLIFYTIIIGILGARIYYIIFNLNYYLQNPIEMLMIRNGGLAIHGGLLFGIAFIIYYCKKHNKNIIKILDIVAPGVIIAQAIGRWGNFFNSEAHGGLTTLYNLKKLHIPSFIRNGMKIDGIYYFPTFFFESIWCTIGFVLMILFRKKKNINLGFFTSFYLFWYSFGRFFIESLRTDSLMLFNLKVAQIVSIIGIIVGITLLIISYNKKEKYYES